MKTCGADRRIQWRIFLWFFCVYSLTMRGSVMGDNYVAYLGIRSLIHDHTLAIEADDERDWNYAGSIKARMVQGREGKFYGICPIGRVLSFLPFYVMGQILIAISRVPPIGEWDWSMFFANFMSVFCTAASAALLFGLLRRMSVSVRATLWVVFLYGFGTMAWYYSRDAFAEAPNTLALFGAFVALYEYRDTRSPRYLWWAGLGFGIGFAMKPYDLLFLPLFLWYLALPDRERKDRWQQKVSELFRFSIPIVVAIVFTIGVNLYFLGWSRPLSYPTSGPTLVELHTHLTDLWVGFYGLLLSPGKSIFLFNPPLILAVVLWSRVWLRMRRENIFIAAYAGLHLLFFAFHNWADGPPYGPRYFVPILPFCLIPLGHALDSLNLQRRPTRVCLGLFAAASAVLHLPVITMGHHPWLSCIARHGYSKDLMEGLGTPLIKYNVYFIPRLAPLYGDWLMFCSMLHKVLWGTSLSHPLLQPDATFQLISLAPWDKPSIWFLHMGGRGAVLAGLLLVGLIIISTQLWREIRKTQPECL